MVARRTEEANRLYLVTCPACGASNPVNAGGCWHCEQDLPVRGTATGVLAPHGATPEDAPIPGAPPSYFPVLREEVAGQAANDDEPGWDASSSLTSFLAEQPAADKAARRGAIRRRIVGAASVAFAAALAFWWIGRGGEKAASEVPVAQRADAVPSAAGLRSSPGPAPGTAGPQPPAAAPAQGQAAQAAEVAVALRALALPAQTTPAQTTPAQATAQTTAAPQRLDSAPVRVPVRRRATITPDDATAPSAPPPVKAPCTPNVAALGLCSTGSQ